MSTPITPTYQPSALYSPINNGAPISASPYGPNFVGSSHAFSNGVPVVPGQNSPDTPFVGSAASGNPTTVSPYGPVPLSSPYLPRFPVTTTVGMTATTSRAGSPGIAQSRLPLTNLTTSVSAPMTPAVASPVQLNRPMNVRVPPRGRQQDNTALSSPHARQHQQQQQTRHSRIAGFPPLLPAASSGAPHIPRPYTLRASLHQAHLRGPMWKCVADSPGGQQVNAQLLMYMESLIVPVTPLGKEESVFHWTFRLSRQDVEKFPEIKDPGEGRKVTNVLRDLTQLYLFQCIKMPAEEEPVSDSTWTLAETAWPSVIYVLVNGKEMEVKRRLRNIKDSPLDITPNLKEGENTVSLYFLRGREEMTEHFYAAAVDMIKVVDLDAAKAMAVTVPSSECRQQIMDRLRSPDGDDVAIVSEDITVNLCDPFTSKIFNVPARGRLCPHVECFDLGTFLSTKSAASKNPLKDRWKCPICGGDARPNNLMIDGFLSEVRSVLEKKGQLDEVRAIEVNSKGEWKQKEIHDDEGGNARATTTNGQVLGTRKRSTDRPDVGRSARRVKLENHESLMSDVAYEQPLEVITLD